MTLICVDVEEIASTKSENVWFEAYTKSDFQPRMPRKLSKTLWMIWNDSGSEDLVTY